MGGRNISSEHQVSDFGVFVKEIIEDRLADQDGIYTLHACIMFINYVSYIIILFVSVGRLKRGDQLLEANGISLSGVSNDRSVNAI